MLKMEWEAGCVFKNFYTVPLKKVKKMIETGNLVIVLMDRPKIVKISVPENRFNTSLLSLPKFCESPGFKCQTQRQHKAEITYVLFIWGFK